MTYPEFYKRFGASYRIKHLACSEKDRPDTIRKPPHKLARRNLRSWNLPTTSELPEKFIRLCPWEGEYLFNLVRRAKFGILETGRFMGGSCFLMSCANPNVPIYSIDIAPQNDSFLREKFNELGVGANVDLIVGDSQKTKYPQVKSYDLLWIDGDHSYHGCLNDLKNWFEGLAPGGHIVLHDCYEGNPVKDSILDFIAQCPEVSPVNTPYRGRHHWLLPEGSMFHMIKTSLKNPLTSQPSR